MVARNRKQTLSDFSGNPAETLRRLTETGEAEILTVDGEDRVVLLSPAAFDELSLERQLAQDVEAIRRSMKQIDDEEGCAADVYFDRLHTQLVSLKRSAT